MSDVTNLISLWFFTFPIVFLKTELFISLLSNSFFAFVLSLVFMPMYGFNHAFWLNISFFLVLTHDVILVFKGLMWITYFSLSSMVQISFWTFSTSFLPARNSKSLWLLDNVYRYSTSTSRKFLYYYLHQIFFLKSSLNFDKFFTHLNPFTGSFWDISHPYKLFASKYSIYDDLLFLS